MAIYKNGKKLDVIYKNDKKIDKIYKNGHVIYSSFTIKPFATCTDEELAQYLDMHYAGEIDISKYWKVGDTRVVHINATNSGTCDHVAQDMTMVIYGFNHDDLATSINEISKAAVTVGFREIMGNMGKAENEYYTGKSYNYEIKDTDNYLSSSFSLRTWLNGSLLNALPSTFRNMIKSVKKKNLKYHSKSEESPQISYDRIWLLSYPEVFGTESNYYYLKAANPSNYEGEQYEYMKNSSNRIKKANNNGTAISNEKIYYWLRSPSSSYLNGYGYDLLIVDFEGSLMSSLRISLFGLAPAFCL